MTLPVWAAFRHDNQPACGALLTVCQIRMSVPPAEMDLSCIPALDWVQTGDRGNHGRTPGAKPRLLAKAAVAKREKAEQMMVLPKISGACLTMSLRCPKILKPKERMTTPRKLMRMSPPPRGAPTPCTPNEVLISSAAQLRFQELHLHLSRAKTAKPQDQAD